ncbi:hypothetical protein, partial [Deinococcus sp.]|uniref:hypothetical protein n=1 Tax=Deinococcus sp. TaxID=47478 RepID=UPI002869DD62
MRAIMLALAVLAFGVGAAGYAAPVPPATLNLPAPAVWLAADGPQVYALTAQGDLLDLQGSTVRRLARAFSAQVITACSGRVVGVNGAGTLQVWTGQGVQTAPDADLSPLAHPVCLPLGVVVVAQSGDLRRYEPVGGGWQQTAHTAAQALPDAQLTLADLDGTGDAQVVALTHPDQRRYDHGILGDATEATEITVFERHSLSVLDRLTLPAPFVFEDVQARPVRLEGGRDGLAVVRSSAAGSAALALIGRVDGHLSVQATSPDFGQTHRWLSPLVGSGQLW